MRLHGNAALSWSGRRRLAERVVVEGWTLTAAAEAAGVSVRCARKWTGRYRLEGEQGLLDRSSRPRRVANRTPEERVRLIVGLRRLRFTAAEIAELLGMALSTVSGILARQGMGRLGRLGLEQPRRYERSRVGCVNTISLQTEQIRTADEFTYPTGPNKALGLHSARRLGV